MDYQVRIDLAAAISREIKERELLHRDVSEMTGVMRAHVGYITAGRVDTFSVSRLMGILTLLGAKVSISVDRSPAAQALIDAGGAKPNAKQALRGVIGKDGAEPEKALAALVEQGFCVPEADRVIRRGVAGGYIAARGGVLFVNDSEIVSAA